MLGQSETIKDFQNRFPIFFYIICGIFLLIATRLFYLQVYRGQMYRRFSEQNSLRKEKLPGPRGQIFDRYGKLMVDNRLQLDITIAPQFTKNPNEVIRKLAVLADESYDRLWERFQQKKNQAFGFQTLTILEDAPWPVVVKIESSKDGLTGVDVETRIRRTYLNQQVGAQLFGYLSEVSKRDIEGALKNELGTYELGDYIGRAGLERQWEKYLRGVAGVRFVEVNAHGHRVAASASDSGSLMTQLPPDVEPRSGSNLVLTIDADLEMAAATAMKGKMGAVVAMDPRTGEVLTMLSNPAFDPTELTSRGPELWQSIVKNPYAPLRNKALQDHFPAGSTFKPFTALAALEQGIVTENTTVRCPGFFKFGNRVYHCHKKEGHGIVNLHDAIKQSCDVYFYYIASRLGIDFISNTAMSFGFGSRSGIELANEVPGLMPTEAWKQKTYKQIWQPGETLSASIGQGYNLVTPLQLALSYSTLVNGGNLYRPYVVSRVEDGDGKLIKQFTPSLKSNHKVNPQFLKAIEDGLYAVVNEPGGTAVRPFASMKDKIVSGKSGTAQVMSFSKEDLFKPCINLPFEKRHHAWFVGYAPRINPEIVVATLGMHECGGSANASPVVKAVIEKWWEKKQAAEAAQGPRPAQAAPPPETPSHAR